MLFEFAAIPWVGPSNLLGSVPTTKAQLHEYAWKEVQRLDGLILKKGLDDPSARKSIRNGAAALRKLFEDKGIRTGEDAMLVARTHELLRDAGVEGEPSRPDITSIRRHADAAVALYAEIRDYRNLGKALIASANTCRLDEDDRTADRMFRAGYHILNERCSRTDPGIARLLHQVSFWKLRLSAQNLDRCEIRKQLNDLSNLACELGEPSVHLETYREEVGCLTHELRDYDKAAERLVEMKELLRGMSFQPSYPAPTLLRPEIELLIKTGEKDAAIHLIENDYATLYRNNRHLHYYRVLQSWIRKYGLSIQVPSPAYASPILIYLPR